MILQSSVWEKAMDYRSYRELIDTLLAEGKTTGPNQSQSLVDYSRLNQQRMQRIETHNSISPETTQALSTIAPSVWLVLTEGWCGDAAQNLPFLDKMASSAEQIKLRLLLRDENPELMEQFLTNGSRSIPKLIWIDPSSGEVKADWGPRPAIAQQMVRDMKAQGVEHDEFIKAVHGWYAKDKGSEIQKEIVALAKKINPS